MNALFTGKGSSGSWQCRGVQLGGVIGAVKPLASPADCAAADVIVVVKRINHRFFEAVRQSGKPWVWDLVDFYPQPGAGSWTRKDAIRWVLDQLRQARPDGIIYPNRRMADDIGLPGTVIYHHARPAPTNPVREQVRVVGYEGSPAFLGRWRDHIVAECQARGWRFVEDAPLADVDIVVAFRDGQHDGYVQRAWKSNVKLANAHGTGTPFVGQPDVAYCETATGHERWATDVPALRRAFDELTPQAARQAAHKAFLANTYTLESRAEQLRNYLATLLHRR